MQRLHVRLDQAPIVYGWDALASFVAHLDESSAVWRAKNPELARFGSTVKQSAILADIYDMLHWQLVLQARLNPRVKSHVPDPKPYPRPGAKSDDMRIGAEPIAISEFEEWYYGG